jgi:hypothetical protein
MEQLSCVIIANNNLTELEKCIKSVNAVCNEIIVVTNTQTNVPLKFDYKVKTVTAKTNNEKDQYLLGISLVTNELVLLLNSSEHLSNDCQLSLIDVKLANNYQAYSIQVSYTFENKIVNLSAWKEPYEIRVFNKSKGKMRFHRMNLTWKPYNGFAKNKMLMGEITSTRFNEFSECISFAKQHSELKAQFYVSNNKHTNYARIYIAPFIKFIMEFLLKGGIATGIQGYKLSKIVAMSESIFQKRVMELQRGKKKL